MVELNSIALRQLESNARVLGAGDARLGLRQRLDEIAHVFEPLIFTNPH